MREVRVVDQVAKIHIVDVYRIDIDIKRRMHKERAVRLWVKRWAVTGIDSETSKKFTTLSGGRLTFFILRKLIRTSN